MNSEIKYRVAEIFTSINGESVCAGELALFIRFCGCNLKCSYCDTKWANQPDTPYVEYTPEQLCDTAVRQGIRNITITGGEPLLQKNIGFLIDRLGHLGFRVEIETNGSISVKEFSELDNRPCFTLDYKLPSSGMNDKMNMENYRYLCSKDTVKFVCGSRSDLEIALDIISAHKLADKCSVYLSPVFGSIDPAEIVEFMKKNNMNGVRIQLQMHKYIWNPDTKGV